MSAVKTLLLLLLLALTSTSAETAPRTLIRKCCPPQQQLSSHLDSCVPYDGGGDEASTEDPDAEMEGISTLLRRSPSGFPNWMSPSTPVYNATSGDPSTGRFLDEQPPEAVVRYGPRPPCDRSHSKYFVSRSVMRYRLLSNGTLLLKTDGEGDARVPMDPDDYCVDRVNLVTDTFVFLACPCNRTVCISKCCNRLQKHTIEESRRQVSFTCDDLQDSAPKWSPRFVAFRGSKEILKNVTHVVLDSNPPKCPTNSLPVLLNTQTSEKPNALWVLPNGSAVMDGFGKGVPFAPGSWCGEWGVLADGTRADSALFCLKLQPSGRDSGKPILYGALFAVSALFLFLTLLVHVVLPEMRQTSYSMALLCHVAALLVGSLALASGQLRSVVDSNAECYVMGFVIQYSMLAAFFWLSVVCFDIARAIRGVDRRPAADRRLFLCYSLYAWGSPAVISGVTIALQFAEDMPASVVLPDIGISGCWFHSKASGWAYFYGPMAVLLAANVLLFAVAAGQVLRGRSAAGASAAGGAGGTRPLLRSVGTAAVLFVLMGVSWLCEVASFAEGSDSLIWTVMDVVNILRGLFIFVLLCCRPKVGRLLRQRLCGTTHDISSDGRTSVYSALQMESVGGIHDAPTPPLASVPARAASRQL